jgi:hypothetical protein
MKNKSGIFLCIAFIFSIAGAFAQDVIIRKNGDRIYCRIVGEDSVSIYYLRKPQKMRFEIKKLEVESYEMSSRLSARKLARGTTLDTSDKKEELAILSFYGGLAVPLSEFKNSNLKDSAAGFAKPGACFRTSLTFKLTKYFGLSASYCYQTHAFDVASFDAQVRQVNPPGTSVQSQSGNWKIRGFYGGVYLTLPAKKKKDLSFDLDLSVGYPLYTYPELDTQASLNGQSIVINQYSSDKRALTFLGTLGLRYKLEKHIVFNFNIGFLAGKPAFSNIFTVSSAGLASYDNYTQKVSSINLQAGLSFLLH